MRMEQLIEKLQRINGKGYKAYKDIQGKYDGEWFTLHIDYVQGDPFASPSRIRFTVPQSIAKMKQEWYDKAWRRIALEDFLTHETAQAIQKNHRHIGGAGKSGMIRIDVPGQEVLKRTTLKVTDEEVDIRLSVGLPASGRTILGKQAIQILCEMIPAMIEDAVLRLRTDLLLRHLELADQQQEIRRYLREHQLVSFVANGSFLPRESGVSNRPLRGEYVIAFQSPPSLEVEIPLPHGRILRGMGIRKGITLIVGGGYHGKSTLLKAIERGVYNHIPEDGREYVITEQSAFKIRAEDGRRVEKVNISPFITNLPFGKDTVRFSTEDASGSTSQAANIMEALEMGAGTLLMDEDTSATNFMIRDARMQKLVAKRKEPITPFIDKIRPLYEDKGVSTVLVVGGSGDYLDAADTVIMMDEYVPYDVTNEAKHITREIQSLRRAEGGEQFGDNTDRIVKPESFDASRGSREKVDAKGLTTIMYGTNKIDLTYVEQLVDESQTRAIAEMMKYTARNIMKGREMALSDLIMQLYEHVKQSGLDAISPYYGAHPGDLAFPRELELAAAMNRLRTLVIQ
jgi:predicted ABC-class ATPase